MSLDYMIIAIYCICDDFEKSRGFRDSSLAKISKAELLTILCVVARLFHGSFVYKS